MYGYRLYEFVINIIEFTVFSNQLTNCFIMTYILSYTPCDGFIIMATSAEIKTLFKTYFDAFSFNLSNNQLNSIFEKAQNIYWGR